MTGRQPSATAQAALDRLRGRALPKNHDARTISALAANPGCARRALMDAAGVDKQRVAAHAGFPAPFGQSRFAIVRGNAFEAQVKENGAAQLLTLLRELLGLDVSEVGYADFNDVGGNSSAELRHLHTRHVLTAPDQPGRTLLDHPLLRLRVGGRPAYLEPDLIALRLDGTFHVIEIKSFAVIDGQADPGKVAAAAIQSAVYVRALRDLVAEAGGDPAAVSHRTILVAPEGLLQPADRRQPRRPQAAGRARPPAQPDRQHRGPARPVPGHAHLRPRPGPAGPAPPPGGRADRRHRPGRRQLRARVPGHLRALLPVPRRGGRHHRRARQAGPRGPGRHRVHRPGPQPRPRPAARPGAGGDRGPAAARRPAARRRCSGRRSSRRDPADRIRPGRGGRRRPRPAHPHRPARSPRPASAGRHPAAAGGRGVRAARGHARRRPGQAADCSPSTSRATAPGGSSSRPTWPRSSSATSTRYLPADDDAADDPGTDAGSDQDRAPAPEPLPDAPQLLVPNPNAAAFLRLLGRSTRLRRTDGEYAVRPTVPLLGRWLTHYAERAEVPGSVLLLPMTTALAEHWATGQSDLEDANLAALLGWIDPADGLTGQQAARLAEDPVRCPPAGRSPTRPSTTRCWRGGCRRSGTPPRRATARPSPARRRRWTPPCTPSSPRPGS